MPGLNRYGFFIVFVLAVVTMTYRASIFKSGRMPAQADGPNTFSPDEEKKIVNAFVNTCNGCHNEKFTQNSAGIIKGNFEIYSRMKWLETATGPVSPEECGGCMPFLLSQDDLSANHEMLLKMVRYAKPDVMPTYANLVGNLRPQHAGFKINMLAQVEGARSITVAPHNTLYIGTGSFSNPKTWVYRVTMANLDSDQPEVNVDKFITGLSDPNGVTYVNGNLYVAENSRLLLFQGVDNAKSMSPSQATEITTFPAADRHKSKYMRLSPDSKWLYITIGSPCEVCIPGPGLGRIVRVNLQTKKSEVVATGIRNSMGIDFAPQTNNLWLTENGRDGIGDDQPADKLHVVLHPGKDDFGFPFCHSKMGASGIELFPESEDPDVMAAAAQNHVDCSTVVKPVAIFNPHSAALGMSFYRDSGAKNVFPQPFNSGIYAALHGSYNRSRKEGYAVVRVDTTTGEVQPFIKGWVIEDKQAAWGRPVDVQTLEDGSMIISDDGIPRSDFQGAIYRVTATK